MERSNGEVVGKAAIMMVQSLVLALVDRGVLSADDVMDALGGVIEAQPSGDDDLNGDSRRCGGS